MNTLSEAKRWRNLGIATIPIRAGSKAPALDSWRPYQERLPTLRELTIWFSSGQYGLAVLTGWRGLVVIDFDNPWRYSEWLASLAGDIASLALSTYQVRTRRGKHFYFYCDTPAECWAGDGVDVKAAGGYVLAPPSVHPSGHVYAPLSKPSQIATIGKVGDLLPAYDKRDAPPPIVAGDHAAHDPYDDAMRDSAPTGTSIEEIKRRHSIASLMGVRQNGQRVMVNCPFHNDEHASFAIYNDGHGFCFGCQRWFGDVLDFYAELHGLSLADAMREMGGEL